MSAVSPYIFPRKSPYRHISTRFDSQHGALWLFLDPKPRPCVSFDLIDELRMFHDEVERTFVSGDGDERIHYFIAASKSPRVFNLGGDLQLFARCVAERDADTLRKYARGCIETLYPFILGYNLPITTISLVQGDALGGGFEIALAGDVLVAERGAQLGFPEVMFNLFPGMGAYNLLHRKIGMTQTERMILSGKAYRAEDLYARGVVDILADDGNGEKALYEHIVRLAGKDRSSAAIHQVRRRLCPVRYEQLLEVVEIWVDTALRMGPRQLRMMEKLVRAQERVAVPAPASASGNGGVPPL
jgi:DSF synthase